MFDRELMILGLRKQQNLLVTLIELLEGKPEWDNSDGGLYVEQTHRVAKNLRQLRKIKNNYLAYRN